jgi:MFS family permease
LILALSVSKLGALTQLGQQQFKSPDHKRLKTLRERLNSVSLDRKPMDSRLDRRNGNLFLYSFVLIFLEAPVLYVGVVQAALCDKLGASATVANLPASAYFLGNFAPILFAWIVPHRLERFVVVVANAFTAGLMVLVATALLLPIDDSIRIGVVVGQGLLLGVAASLNQVYIFQCLGRGTTEKGRARTLKLTFTVGPLAAVAGSLAAQFVLGGGISMLMYPRDFAFLYLVGMSCSSLVAWLSSRFELEPLPEESRPALFPYLRKTFRHYASFRPLVLLWVAYLLWYSTLLAMPNLSLYTKQAIGRDPKDLSGYIMAMRFGCKAGAGYALGVLNIQYGIRAPLIATVLFLGAALLWAWAAPGYFYLLAFGLMGAGELGGAYFPNVLLSLSPLADGARNMSILNLASVVASPSPVLHGMLTDHWGFPASFALGIATALAALWLVWKLPVGRRKSYPLFDPWSTRVS